MIIWGAYNSGCYGPTGQFSSPSLYGRAFGHPVSVINPAPFINTVAGNFPNVYSSFNTAIFARAVCVINPAYIFLTPAYGQTATNPMKQGDPGAFASGLYNQSSQATTGYSGAAPASQPPPEKAPPQPVAKEPPADPYPASDYGSDKTEVDEESVRPADVGPPPVDLPEPQEEQLSSPVMMSEALETKLNEAMAYNDTAQAVELLNQQQEGLLAQLVNSGGFSILSMACWHGHRQLVEELLKVGADPNRMDNNQSKETPLHNACRHNDH